MDSKTPVTLLQEFLTKRGTLPTYTLVYNRVGTHEPQFKYEVSASGKKAIGSGSSKKEAKHDAARILLLDFQVEENASEDLAANVQSPYAAVVKDNAVGQLQDLCLEHHTRMPLYELIRDEGLAHAKIFTIRCTVSSLVSEATARTKKQAKQLAAQQMIVLLKEYFQICEKQNDSQNEVMFLKEEELKESNEEALKVVQRSTNSFIRSPPLGMNISDFQKFYVDHSFPKSTFLEEIKEGNDESFNNEPKEVFEKIISELTFEYKKGSLPSKVEGNKISYIEVNSEMPPWVFICTGPSIESAEKQCYIEGIKFFITMSTI